jgi:hypothetical protein
MVPSSDGSQLLFVNPSALQEACFLGTKTKSIEKDGGISTIEKQQQQGNLPFNKGRHELSPKNCKPRQQVQQLAKLKNNKPVNNHKELELRLQDLNFTKLNQTRTKTMERSTEQGSNTRAPMPTMNETVLQPICTIII